MGVTPDRISGFLVLASCFALLTNAAAAAPPASCVCKFVGEWSYPGGTTTVYANGTAQPHCAMCVPVQTWTCKRQYLSLQSGPPGQFSATLVDANHMQYSGGVATRTRAGACSAGGTEKKPKGGTGWVTRQRERRSIGATRNAFRRRTATRSRNAITDSPISAPSPRKWSVPASRNGSESRLRRSEAQRRCRAWSAASVSVDLKLFVVNGPRRCGRRTRPGF